MITRSLLAATACLLLFAPASAADREAVTARLDADGVQRASILGGDYFFEPRYLVVKANVPVELSVRKEEGLIPHTFVITAPEAGIDVDVKLSREPVKVRFTPTAVGQYPYFCAERLLFFKSHRERGMAGILEVVP